MTDFPPIGAELRLKPKLKRHTNTSATDEEIEANSRQIGQKWGASTSITDVPALLPSPVEPVHAPPPTPVTSIRGYIPQYLDDELTIKSAERRVTKTFLIMEALAKAGYHVAEGDLIQDRRKKQKGN